MLINTCFVDIYRVQIWLEGGSLLGFLISKEFCSIFSFIFQFLVDLALFNGIVCVWWRTGRVFGDLVGKIEDHNLFRVSSSLSIMLSIIFVLFQFLVMF